MFFVPILKHIQPMSAVIKQTRNLRPIVKISKERFQITLDVRQFDKEELRVKARPEYVMIEGKQERKTGEGYMIRHFVRKFKLPKGCDPHKIKSKMTSTGLLTITAPRLTCSHNLPCEKLIEIKFTQGGDPASVDSLIPPTDSATASTTNKTIPNVCEAYLKPKIVPKEQPAVNKNDKKYFGFIFMASKLVLRR